MKLKIERLRDFERDPSNNFLTRSEMMEAVKELIALREAMNGEQVPEVSLAEHCKHASEIVDTWPQWKRNGADVTKFTAPQKPAVLLGKGFKRDIIAGMSAPETEWFSRKDVTAAIEAAGGKVAK